MPVLVLGEREKDRGSVWGGNKLYVFDSTFTLTLLEVALVGVVVAAV